METLIQPKVLKGFRDYLPAAEIRRAILQEKLTKAYRSFGFVPIDTPVLEYSEILLRKSNGETEKQVFRFQDNGGRDVALRFDLTVPFARFVAEHKDELYFPFKRYHMAKVWRGEKPQAGRYREFVQCDFDIVGSDSAASDFEILFLMKTALSAIGVDNITIRMSHRGVFNAFLQSIGESNKSEDILRTVDKLAKIGQDEVFNQLVSLFSGKSNTDGTIDAADDSISEKQISDAKDKALKVIKFITGSDSFDNTLNLMATLSEAFNNDNSVANQNAVEGINRLKEIRAMMDAAGISATYVLDPSITRGLDYYTGVVYETFLNDLPSIGSVCSGGRYDNLAGLYMKERVPGVGSSIGLDRLIAGLEQLGAIDEKNSFLDVEIFCLDSSLAADYQKTAAILRKLGISCEVFPDPKKISQQYTVAEKKGIPFGIFIKSEDVEQNTLSLKNLKTREIFENISAEEAAEKIKSFQ